MTAPLLVPRACCPICTEAVVIRLPHDWRERVDAGGAIEHVGCGNPWHYAGLDDPQDIEDGQAMRLLREALPDGWQAVVILTPVVLTIGPDATIAEAADACRSALGERS